MKEWGKQLIKSKRGEPQVICHSLKPLSPFDISCLEWKMRTRWEPIPALATLSAKPL